MDDHRIVKALIQRIRELEEATECYANELSVSESRRRHQADELRRRREADEAEATWRWYNRERALFELERAQRDDDEWRERQARQELERWL